MLSHWPGDLRRAQPLTARKSGSRVRNPAEGMDIRACIQKFPEWPPGARIANGTALCHKAQLYRYFVSQSSEFCRHKPLCCISTSVYYCCFYFVIDSVRELMDTPSYVSDFLCCPVKFEI
jgi:hypothetical protein